MDSCWIAHFGPAQRCIFPNPMGRKRLIDCIAQVHTHTLLHGLSTPFSAETVILRKSLMPLGGTLNNENRERADVCATTQGPAPRMPAPRFVGIPRRLGVRGFCW